jgi:nucleoside-diphosphate-sugar epimerase
MRNIIITGASGLLGGAVLHRLLREEPLVTATALLRSAEARASMARRLGPLAARVRMVHADVAAPGLALDPAERRSITASANLIVHCAAHTSFSQSLAHGRRVNRNGTRRILELAAECPALEGVVHVSTAFVAGRRTGLIPEAAPDGAAGFVNAYEQSKYEAEQCVLDSGLPAIIVRPSTVVCDGADGAISQVNAVHRALLLCRAGLAAMVPGGADTTVDLVTTDHVAGGIARLALQDELQPAVYHLCAGTGAIPLDELLDRAFASWSRDARWRRRGVERPCVASLSTYRLFESSVLETGDARLRAITRSLTHFVPQLALPKAFATSAAESALGWRAPAVTSFIGAMLEHLARRRTAGAAGAASRDAQERSAA